MNGMAKQDRIHPWGTTPSELREFCVSNAEMAILRIIEGTISGADRERLGALPIARLRTTLRRLIGAMTDGPYTK